MRSTSYLTAGKWLAQIVLLCISTSVCFSQSRESDNSSPATTQATQPADTRPAEAAASQPAGPGAAAIDLSSPEAALRQALAYKQKGDIADALRCFDAAGTRFPKNEELLNDYGR
jgi:Tfp pilus assembly protein PilF